MTNIAALVDRALRSAGIPIEGVSLGDPTTRATWAVQFSSSATPAQKAAALSLLATVAIDAAAQAVADQQEAQAFIDSLPLWAKAQTLAIIDALNVIRAALPTPLAAITPGQAIAAIRAKAGTL